MGLCLIILTTYPEVCYELIVFTTYCLQKCRPGFNAFKPLVLRLYHAFIITARYFIALCFASNKQLMGVELLNIDHLNIFKSICFRNKMFNLTLQCWDKNFEEMVYELTPIIL